MYEEAAPGRSRARRFESEHLRVEMFDVGAGEAILLTDPEGSTVLVDGGCKRKSTSLADGLAKAIPEHSLKAFVATHPHFDHLGAIQHLVRSHPDRLAPNAVFYEPGTKPRPRACGGDPPFWTELRDALTPRPGGPNITRKTVTERESPLRADVLAGATTSLYALPYNPGDYQSVFMHVAFEKANLLFTGDSNCDYENMLLDRFDDGRGDDVFSAHALKVTHHGSQNGTGRRFGARVNPGLAFASTNKDGDHRWENVSRRRLPEGCLRLETWERGDIVIETDGSRYKGGLLFRVQTGRMTLGKHLRLAKLQDRETYPGAEETSWSQNRACGEAS